MTRVLDIQEPQVCVNFPDDPQFTWHHRILLCRINAGRWLTLTPDHEIIPHNLNVIPNVVLDRGGEFPPGIRNSTYAFDPIDASSLTVFKRRAKLQAAILGEAEGLEAQRALIWVFSDPTDALFGTVLDNDVMDDANPPGFHTLCAYQQRVRQTGFHTLRTYRQMILTPGFSTLKR